MEDGARRPLARAPAERRGSLRCDPAAAADEDWLAAGARRARTTRTHLARSPALPQRPAPQPSASAGRAACLFGRHADPLI